jgi:hypothetical protein
VRGADIKQAVSRRGAMRLSLWNWVGEQGRDGRGKVGRYGRYGEVERALLDALQQGTACLLWKASEKGPGGFLAMAMSDGFAHLEPCQVIKTGVPKKCLKPCKLLKNKGCPPFWEADVLPLNYARDAVWWRILASSPPAANGQSGNK